MIDDIAPLSLVIVLVNYNTAAETLTCIDSLLGAQVAGVKIEILVVDNSDEKEFPELSNITILRPGKNVGLSRAWYLAWEKVRNANYDHVILLNNDVIVSPRFFEKMLGGVEKWGKLCTFGARIYRLDQPEVIWSRGGLIDSRKVMVRHYDCDVHKDTVKQGDFRTGHVSGCCLIIPTKIMNKIGGPDPNFFFRGEEWDINFRILEAGGQLVILDDMEIWHAINASHNRLDPSMLYLAYRGKVLFARKHHSALWFPCWYLIGLLYSFTIAPKKFANSVSDRKLVRKALVLAFLDGLRWRSIKPRSGLD